jgi:hypothetical protein
MRDLRCLVGLHNDVQQSSDETPKVSGHRGIGFFVACTRCQRSKWVRVDPTTPNPSLDSGGTGSDGGGSN